MLKAILYHASKATLVLKMVIVVFRPNSALIILIALVIPSVILMRESANGNAIQMKTVH